MLLDALNELLLLLVLVASGLGAGSGVIDPLVPDRSIRLLPPLSDTSSPLLSSPGELSGKQAVTFCMGAVGLGSEGLLYEPVATSSFAIKGALVVGGERRTSSTSTWPMVRVGGAAMLVKATDKR